AAGRAGLGGGRAGRGRALRRRVPRRDSQRGLQPMSRILLVEDNQDLAFGLKTALENEGFAVALAADGSAGLTQATRDAVDLIILDLMLPRMDGYRVLGALRAAGIEAPVLVLTAKGEEADKVQ